MAKKVAKKAVKKVAKKAVKKVAKKAVKKVAESKVEDKENSTTEVISEEKPKAAKSKAVDPKDEVVESIEKAIKAMDNCINTLKKEGKNGLRYIVCKKQLVRMIRTIK